jgi:cob(I)yrinic acid a,c-diamide adenosyltransferase (EC 2.5.1.17)
MLNDPSFDLLVFDELTYLLSYYLDSDLVLDAIASRPAMQHVIVTGAARRTPDRAGRHRLHHCR